ncbi:17S U2 SnRNP complex component HTATSF1-like [Diretmus argenteus]
MSGDESGGNKEFLEQLRMQQLYGQPREDGSDPYTFTDPEDGTVYDWDHDKKAWFPKITEDFIAAYQANYGFTQDGDPDANASAVSSADPVAPGPDSKAPGQKNPRDPPQTLNSNQNETPAKDAKQKGEKRKLEPGWFDVDSDKNTNVYVSGLPPDISTEEFVELMSKCGIVMRDPITEDYKIKLYKDGQGNLKGDGLCCYLKKESVALAMRLIDESEVRGYKLHVEAARFELKGTYDASKKKKKNKEYKKKLQAQQKQLDWRPEKKGEVRKRHEKVIIIQNMFHPSDFEEDPLVLNEYREDLRTECEKFGQVKKVIIFDRHPDGVASVAFKEPEHADACLLALDGRWFGGKKLSAQLWDGTTDYQIEETTREREERLKGWSTFLEGANKEGQQGTNTSRPAEGAGEADPAQTPSATEPGPGQDGTAANPEPDRAKRPSHDPETEPQPPEQQEQEVDSTDSSLAGSDDEET